MKRIGKIKNIDKGWKNILFNVFFIAIAGTAIFMSHDNLAIYLIILGSISVLGMIKWRSVITTLIFVFAALISPISEVTSVYLGVWTYANSRSFMIPLWLTFAWGSIGAFIYQTFLEIKRLTIRKWGQEKD